MQKWIYELILSAITVTATFIALGQTRQQMRLSNKQALFEKRLNTYMFVKGLMELCNSNKTHFREYRDDVCLTNKLIFEFLTNNYCLFYDKEKNKMKYDVGNIVCLYDERTVYVFAIDEKEEKYQVFDTENEEVSFMVSEDEIFMKLI